MEQYDPLIDTLITVHYPIVELIVLCRERLQTLLVNRPGVHTAKDDHHAENTQITLGIRKAISTCIDISNLANLIAYLNANCSQAVKHGTRIDDRKFFGTGIQTHYTTPVHPWNEET